MPQGSTGDQGLATLAPQRLCPEVATENLTCTASQPAALGDRRPQTCPRDPALEIIMEANGSSVGEDNPDSVSGTRRRRGRGRPRHNFTKNELHILNQWFEQDPYPGFTTKKELADQIHCDLYVVENWFQNRRARLPPRERHRIFATRRRQESSVQGPPLPAYQNNKVPPFYGQEALLGRANYSPLDTDGVPSGGAGSRDFATTGINMQSSCALGHKGSPGSGPSSRSTPANFNDLATSGQSFERAGDESQAGQYAAPSLFGCVFGGEGEGEQQQQLKRPLCQYAVGQQPNSWRQHLQQLPQSQRDRGNYHAQQSPAEKPRSEIQHH